MNDSKVAENNEKEGYKQKSSRPCWHGKFCIKDDCVFEHNCIQPDCSSKSCKYIHSGNILAQQINQESKKKKDHVENGSQNRSGGQQQGNNQEEKREKKKEDAKKQDRQQLGDNQEQKRGKKKEDTKKKDILCLYYRNCREGDNCQYYHPVSEREAKKGGKEMQEALHFLQKEMKNLRTMNINLTREVKEIRKETNRVRQGGVSQGRTH